MAEIGLVGLGVMGANLALNMAEKARTEAVSRMCALDQSGDIGHDESLHIWRTLGR